MYSFNKQFAGQEVTQYLVKPFKGKTMIYLETATQEELEHVFETVGNHKHVLNEISPDIKKATKVFDEAQSNVVRLMKLVQIDSKKLDKLKIDIENEKNPVKLKTLEERAVKQIEICDSNDKELEEAKLLVVEAKKQLEDLQ